jgi:DNA-binding response OmpR family regulator
MSSVLVVEDDEKIGSMLASALNANGHEAIWQRTGTSALASAREKRFDLVLLDLELPDIDGVDVCRSLKEEQPDCALIMLTARREEMDVIVGLESGADDYLFKPFRMTELLARVRAHLRRTSPPVGTSGPMVVGALVVDPQERRSRLGDRELELRPKEFDLLARLAAAPRTALSREVLMSDVWDENWFGSTKTLDVHVASLRRRLTEAASISDPSVDAPTITTLRGFGYRLDP